MAEYKTNKVAVYSKCLTCQSMANTMDQGAIDSLRELVSVDLARLRFEKERLETDRVENTDMMDGKVERIDARLDRLAELSERLYQYKNILEEG